MKRILVVDDEIQILKALTRMFSESDYEVFPAQNSTDALKLVETESFDMVISDMRMPLPDGYELLNLIKNHYPRMIRVILSGYADEKPMFRAILHNLANLYVFKPWNNNEFLNNVGKLFTTDQLLNSEKLSVVIANIQYPSTAPANCQKLIELIENEDIDAVIDELEKEPEISELLLEVAKSAVYGVMPVKIRQAAIYMGLLNLKCYMRWACAICTVKQTDGIEGHLELLLQHAYLTNRIFLFLYEAFLHKQPPESAMFAGLLHNIGLIILTENLINQGSLKQLNLSVQDFIQLENQEYEISHQQAGAYYLNQWDLPFPIHEAALYHHSPTDSAIIFRELVCAVHIAQSYAWRSLDGLADVSSQTEAFEFLNFSKNEFELRLARYLK